MDGRKSHDSKPEKDSVGAQPDSGTDLLQAKLVADSQIGVGVNQNSAESGQKGAESDKFLPTVALWTEGTSGETSANDIGPGHGWSARYAANFDRDGEAPHLDLAPVLGLPQGADHEQVVLAAAKQEEDLLKDLLS